EVLAQKAQRRLALGDVFGEIGTLDLDQQQRGRKLDTVTPIGVRARIRAVDAKRSIEQIGKPLEHGESTLGGAQVRCTLHARVDDEGLDPLRELREPAV